MVVRHIVKASVTHLEFHDSVTFVSEKDEQISCGNSASLFSFKISRRRSRCRFPKKRKHRIKNIVKINHSFVSASMQ